jgi:FAD/FMN-containing dehydrogenase
MPIERLVPIVGAANVLTADADTTRYLTDWRGRYRGRALAVVRPANTAEVAAMVAACAATGTPIVPQGGNTGLVGGATPDDGGRAVVLSLERLRAVRAIDAAGMSLVAEAGCTLKTVQDAAAAVDLRFPLSLAAEGTATVGGAVSTNAGGVHVLRHGMMRALVLGLEVVLADGRIWHGLRALPKDNTGYDLRALFCGAEGTLGIVTAACLRLVPPTRERAVALVAVPSVAAAVSLLGRTHAAVGEQVEACELISRDGLAAVAAAYPQLRQPFPPAAAGAAPWYVLLELAGARRGAGLARDLEALLADAHADDVAMDAALATSEADAAALWALREHVPLAEARHGGNIKHDISVPVAQLAAFVDAAARRLAERYPWTRPFVFGHLGDGNLHYNVGVADGVPHDRLHTQESGVRDTVLDVVAGMGGSFSAEHGVGQFNRSLLARWRDPVELELMRALKRALDPRGLMNPGKLLPD